MSYGIPTNTHNIAIFEEWCSVRQPLRAWSKWREVLFVAGCGFESGRELADKCSVGHDLANRIIRWAKSIGILVDVGYRKFIAWTALFRPTRGKVTLRQLEEALADNGLSFPVADRYNGHPSDTKAPSIGHPSYMSSGNSLLNERTSDVALVDQQPDSQGTTSSVQQPEQQNTQAQQVGCVKGVDREDWADSKAKYGGSARGYRVGKNTVEERIADLDQCDADCLDPELLRLFDLDTMKNSEKGYWFFNKAFLERVFAWVKAGDGRIPFGLRSKAEGKGQYFDPDSLRYWMSRVCNDARRGDVNGFGTLKELWFDFLKFEQAENKRIAQAKLNNAEFCAPTAEPKVFDSSVVSDEELDAFERHIAKYGGNNGQAMADWPTDGHNFMEMRVALKERGQNSD